MEQNLRVLFDRAIADEPAPPSADLAGEAMAAGTGLRRRRQGLVAVGAAAVAAIAAVGVVNVATPQSVPPATTVPAAFGMLVNKACEFPARETATDASIFLTDEVTDEQRSAVDRALDADPAVRTLAYESREQAYAAFKGMYEDAPELAAAVQVSQMPESFRVALTGRSQYPGLAARVQRLPGVDQVIGIDCPAGTSASAVD